MPANKELTGHPRAPELICKICGKDCKRGEVVIRGDGEEKETFCCRCYFAKEV